MKWNNKNNDNNNNNNNNNNKIIITRTDINITLLLQQFLVMHANWVAGLQSVVATNK